MNKYVVILTLVLLAAGSVQSCAAVPFIELEDAGQIPDLAQDVAVVGIVESIEGRIEHAFDVDLFRFVIHEPAAFSAITVGAETDAPDLQLFLFDAWDHGVVANDNWLFSPMPQIPAGTLETQPPGEYLLGISPSDDDPTGVFGELFPDVETGISKPASTARFDSLLGWTRDFTAVGGNYLIELSAVRGTIPPLPADFDEDGDVDHFDLAQWQAGYAVGTTHQAGDADGDGDVDGRDFLVWQRQFGQGATIFASQPVPEPETLLLACMTFTALGARFRKEVYIEISQRA